MVALRKMVSCCALMLALLPPGGIAARGSEALPRVTAPYRFQPPPSALTPLEQEKAQQYRMQLQERVFDFEREKSRLDTLENEELRRARGELERMNRLIQERLTR